MGKRFSQALQPHPEGTLLPVKANPGARLNGIQGWQQGRLKVAVTQIAEKGKANAAVVAVLAKALQLSKSQIQLMAGESCREKTFLIKGLRPDEFDWGDHPPPDLEP